MKRIRILLSLLLCIAIISGCAVSAGAMLAPLKAGDVDRDYNVTIVDATLIQRFLAYMKEPDELERTLGDVDGDGELTILDATSIQRKLAGMPCYFLERDIYDYYVGDAAFHSSCEIMQADYIMHGRETCYVGVPVTFTAKVRWGAKPRSYSLSVDGEIVEQVSADGNRPASMTYTFEKEGSYVVSTAVECQYGARADHTRTVTVLPRPDSEKPVITGAVFYDASRMSSGDSTLTVHAAGGTGQYEYSYEVCYGSGVIYEIPEGEDEPGYTNVFYRSGYINSNVFNLMDATGSFDPGAYWGNYPTVGVRITVRDSAGNVSDPVTASYVGYEILA